jgi:thiosulfate sulfurtransferase
MSLLKGRELAMWQASGFEFALLDVRRPAARQQDASHIAGAQWLDPALWLDWKDGISNDKPVVFYCAHGHEISQGLTAALRAMGVDARYLKGGMSGWKGSGGAVIAG